jgi:glycine/D-amino acid oxidase-like deaminating enzyme
MATLTKPEHFMWTSGERDSVWIHKDPYSNRPRFNTLDRDIDTDVCVIGAGIAGISTAYELVSRGVEVVMIEAREVLSGETGRTSGHLNSALDDGYLEIEKKHGRDGAKIAAESHGWAVKRVGEISKKLGIDCEYRILPSYEVSQYPRGNKEWEEEISQLKEEVSLDKQLGIEVRYDDDLKIKGWDGQIDQRGGAVYSTQATFHPTKYLNGILRWLKDQPNFACYTHTRMTNITEKGIEIAGLGRKTVEISTVNGHKVSANHAVETTNVPLQKLSVIAEMEYERTYCIAIRVPKDYIEDCLIYDQAEAYKYVRFTECDEKDDCKLHGFDLVELY